jgi:hypothetical protein
MENVICDDLHEICSLWTFRLISALDFDGETYCISKEKIDRLRELIKNKFNDIDNNEEYKRMIKSQSNRILVSLYSRDLIKL